MLRTMFGHDIPAPLCHRDDPLVTRPVRVRLLLLQRVGSTRADRVALGAPVAGRLFFAGEATEPDYSSTVHGAYRTGRRVARQVEAHIR